MAETCLLMYYEGPPREKLHVPVIKTWSSNKNIDFYILSGSKDVIDYFNKITSGYENIFVVKYNILNDVRSALGSEVEKFDKIYENDPLRILRGSIRPFSLSGNLSFILRDYGLRGWIDHDVFISSSFNPSDYFDSNAKSEVWFRHHIGQLLIMNYQLDDYWIKLLRDRISNGQELYGGSKGFLEGTFQNSLRYPCKKSGGIFFMRRIHDFKDLKIMNNDFYYEEKKLVFIAPSGLIYDKFLDFIRTR